MDRAYESGLEELFDISEARSKLQIIRHDLLAECEANGKLQRRFDLINAQMRAGVSAGAGAGAGSNLSGSGGSSSTSSNSGLSSSSSSSAGQGGFEGPGSRFSVVDVGGNADASDGDIWGAGESDGVRY